MHQVQQRIDAMGGSGFIRDCAHWAASLRDAGLRLKYRSISHYLTIDPIPRTADQIAHHLLPYLVTALRKDLIRNITCENGSQNSGGGMLAAH